MASLKKMAAATKEKFRGVGNWFKGKIRRSSSRSSKGKNKIVISQPSNFRKETVTVGTDAEGNPAFIKEPPADPPIMDVGNLLSKEGPADKTVV